MVASDLLTTRQVGDILGQPEWKIRRVVDSLGSIPRFSGRRMISRGLLPQIIDAIRAHDNREAVPEVATA
jgi:hypothetical protein